MMKYQIYRLEQSVNNTERIRDSTSKRYRDFQIPWGWMLDTGLIGQVGRTKHGGSTQKIESRKKKRTLSHCPHLCSYSTLKCISRDCLINEINLANKAA